jgi:plasmid stabilization system protein ParE
MRRVVWLDSAVNDVVRLREFIAANKAAQTIKRTINSLINLPNTGKPIFDLPNYRDLHIRFGAAGYVVRYKVHQNDLYIVHVKHYRELGFIDDNK